MRNGEIITPATLGFSLKYEPLRFISYQEAGSTAWIPISERFPDMYEFVLVFSDNQGSGEPKPIGIGRIIGNKKWDLLGESDVGAFQDIEYGMDSNDITHWMPLPYPPTNLVPKTNELVVT